MSDKDFIQEIEDNSGWRDLNKFYFSDGSGIYSCWWINEVFNTKDPFRNIDDGIFYFAIRSNSRMLDIEHFFRLLFIKIAEVECVEISNEDIKYIGWSHPRGLRTYVAKFTIYNPAYWGRNLTKLAYYMLTLSTIVDFLITGEHMSGDSLSSALYDVFNSRDQLLLRDRFFHSGIADLFNSLIARRNDPEKVRSSLSDGTRLIGTDMDNLVLVLQSRDDVNSVLNRVEEFDSEKITNEMLNQYDTIRRHF
jgi:hypothetical protein